MECLAILVFMSVLASAWASEPFRIQQLNSGVVFEKLPDLILTPYYLTAHVEMNLEVFRREEANLREIANELQSARSEKTFLNDTRTSGLFDNIKHLLSKLSSTLSGLTDTIPRSRQKRGRLGIDDKIDKKSFGPADNVYFKMWNEQKLDSPTQTGNIETNSDFVTIRVNHLEHIIAYIRLLKTATSVLLRGSEILSHTVNENLNDTEFQIAQISEDLATIRNLQMIFYSAASAEIQVYAFRSALQRSLQDSLDPVLLPPQIFLRTLQKIVTRRRTPLQLVRPVSAQFLPDFYELSHVKPIIIGNILRLILKIPTTCVGCTLDLYRIHSFPVMWETVHNFITWQTKEFLALTKDLQYFSTLSASELQNCKHTKNLVCSYLPLQSGIDQCEISLYLAERHSPPCPRVINNLNSPIFEIVGDSLLFVTKEPIVMTAVCYDGELASQTFRFTLYGSGLLTNSSSCDFHGPNIKLYARIIKPANFSTRSFRLYSPNLSFNIYDHKHLLQLNSTIDAHLLSSIDQLLKLKGNQISIDKLAQHVADYHATRKNTTVILIATIVPTLLVTFVYMTCICLRKKKYSRGLVRTSNSEVLQEAPLENVSKKCTDKVCYM